MAFPFPQEDLTCHNFGKPAYKDLSDREYFGWAYQTETKIRFGKLEARNATTSEFHSTTLKSDYLIDVYPCDDKKRGDTSFKDQLERDKSAFGRKAIASLSEAKAPDGSLLPVYIRDQERANNALPSWPFEGSLPVPPNFLYFEMCLKAFTGYELSGLYNSPDPTLPRAAMMGGAIVAALTAWRYIQVIDIFEDSEISDFFEKPSRDAVDLEDYTRVKTETTRLLHDLFHQSAFNAGDVDVFLQMAPFTRQLREKFLEECTVDTHNTIQKFHSTGLGACQDDLHRFSKAALQRLKSSLTVKAYGADFVYALAQNGLSFMLAVDDPEHYDYNEREEDELWPRPTQLIMLQHGADLLGAIMDFDLSIASCAYDGTTVRVTPRAALSLERMLVVVTPFCFEEKRNRTRIQKYVDRGFIPAIIDPNCRHLTECQNCDAVLGHPMSAHGLGGGAWRSRSFRSPEEYNAVLNGVGAWRLGSFRSPEEYNAALNSLGAPPNSNSVVFCCCSRGPTNTCRYAMAVFEKSEGDATEFFARLFDWTAEKRQEVLAIPNTSRWACRRCRNDYSMHLFFKEETQVDESADSLRLDKSFMKTVGYKGTLSPSFYGGPVFDCVKVWGETRGFNECRSAIQGQSHAERIRYIVKNGSEKGYKPRFIFCFHGINMHGIYEDEDPFRSLSDPLDKIFAKAAQHEFPESGRPAIGLNPERIVARCQSCREWLHHCEFGTEYCERCLESKPEAERPIN